VTDKFWIKTHREGRMAKHYICIVFLATQPNYKVLQKCSVKMLNNYIITQKCMLLTNCKRTLKC